MNQIDEFVTIMRTLNFDIHVVKDTKNNVIDMAIGRVRTSISKEISIPHIPSFALSKYTEAHRENKYWYLTFLIGQFSVPVVFSENPLALIPTIQSAYQMISEHDSFDFIILFYQLGGMGFYPILKSTNKLDVILPKQTVEKVEDEIEFYIDHTPPSQEWRKWEVTFRDNTWVVEFLGSEVTRGTLEELKIFFRDNR